MAVDDATLMAYLDGELDEVARRRIEAAFAEDPELSVRLDTQRRLKARIAAHYDPVAEEPVSERFRALLDTNIVDFASARAGPARPLWQSAAALAATLVLGLFLGRALPIGESGSISFEQDMLVARGPLAEALNSQLASAQAAEATTRIGVSFARVDGSLCRTFANASLSGVACREGDDWRMLATAAAIRAPRGEYRQAAAEAPLILQAAQEMMAGEPLDATAELRARDAGWRAQSQN